jgi:hypothetical protein
VPRWVFGNWFMLPIAPLDGRIGAEHGIDCAFI